MNVRLTFVGQTITDLVSVSPDESVTVRVIRYRVRPLKSWPEVGMVNDPLFTPVIGVPGWTWSRWRKSMFQVNALAGSGRPSVSVPVPLKLMTSPALKKTRRWAT